MTTGIAGRASSRWRHRLVVRVPRRRLTRWSSRVLGWALMLALAIAVLPAGPAIWADVESAGHVYSEAQVTAPGGPSADVALVLGAQIEPGGTEPMAFLRGRLDTAAALLASGRVRVLLVSGDEHGSSGDETDVM